MWGAKKGCEQGLLQGQEDPSAVRGGSRGQGPVRRPEQRPGLCVERSRRQGSSGEAAWVVGTSTRGWGPASSSIWLLRLFCRP